MDGLEALRADAVAEFGFGVRVNVFFEAAPASFVISDAFAIGADGDVAVQGFERLDNVRQVR